MRRRVRSLIRLVASGLAVVGVLEIGLEYERYELQVRRRLQPVQIDSWHWIWGGILILLGLLLFAFSARLAEKLTEDSGE